VIADNDSKLLDLAGPKVIDARWFCDAGEARVDNGDNNVLETYGDYDGPRTLVRHVSLPKTSCTLNRPAERGATSE